MNPTVLITGVLGGVGQATAKLFQESGWDVIGVDRRDGNLDSLSEFHRSDVSSEVDLQNLFNKISTSSKLLSALVNNAAIQICKPLMETTLEEWDSIMINNARSVYLAVRTFFPMLKASKGAIVNVSSVHAVATSAGIAAYATSKGAVLALTRALANEFAQYSIRVNAVLPGAVDTLMLRQGLNRGYGQPSNQVDRLNELSRKHPLGRIGDPREIAQAILFLSDPQRSSFITGQSLIVDGGAISRLSTE